MNTVIRFILTTIASVCTLVVAKLFLLKWGIEVDMFKSIFGFIFTWGMSATLFYIYGKSMNLFFNSK